MLWNINHKPKPTNTTKNPDEPAATEQGSQASNTVEISEVSEPAENSEAPELNSFDDTPLDFLFSYLNDTLIGPLFDLLFTIFLL